MSFGSLAPSKISFKVRHCCGALRCAMVAAVDLVETSPVPLRLPSSVPSAGLAPSIPSSSVSLGTTATGFDEDGRGRAMGAKGRGGLTRSIEGASEWQPHELEAACRLQFLTGAVERQVSR
jgi:hypothetical protein